MDTYARQSQIPSKAAMRMALTGAPLLLPSLNDPSQGTRRYYDERAQSYARATQLLPLHEDFEDFATRLPKNARVLDLGCGAGRDMRALAARGFRTIGLDASFPLVELASVFSGCHAVEGDLRSIPFEGESFDGVWASASLLHLRRKEIPAALAEVSRVLRGGGSFFSSVKTGREEGPDSRSRWFTYFEPDEWLSLMRGAGFAIVHSSSTRQVTGTLDKDAPVAWFACTVQK